MIDSVSSASPVQGGIADLLSGTPNRDVRSPALRELDQLLWTEMLSHAGFEKALSRNGGEGASAFTRYIVEDIARDLAEQHPLIAAESGAVGPSAYDVLGAGGRS